MIGALKGIALFTIVLAAIGLTTFLVMHHTLMPEPAQLSQIDAAVQSAAPPGLTVRRLRAPDQIESDGHAKFGYFTYEDVGKTPPARYRADWRITDKKVELISFKPL